NDLGFSYIRNQRGEITTANPLNPQSNWNLANPPQSRTANGLNQYTTLNGTTLTHDPNGNLQSDGIWTYGHDPDNRLVSAVRNNPASSASLGYDPAGRLTRTNINGTVTDLLYDGTDLIAEYDGTGTLTTRHIHGPGIDEPLVSITGTTKTWRYADHLGSIIAEADAMGNATAIRGYGPFGENGTMAPNRFGYTGQQYIAGLGLYYYKARWYSPTLGRFLETDPIGYADGVNWYAYVNNNPINTNDSSGLCPICFGAIYGGIAGGVGGGISAYAANGSVIDAAKGVGLGFFAGAVTGAVTPWLSYSAGAAAGTVGTAAATAVMGGASSAVGQFAGNIVTSQPLGANFSWGAVVGSATGGVLAAVPSKIVGNIAGASVGTSIPFGSNSLTIVTPAVQNTANIFSAVTEGSIGGIFEAGGQAIQSQYSQFMPNVIHGTPK
ncbi:MAG: RHS repeat-associated core domain-containing protein, partial [Candidatus Nitrotoga sp.]